MWTQSGSVSECGEVQQSVQCVHTVQQPGDEAEDEEWDEDSRRQVGSFVH